MGTIKKKLNAVELDKKIRKISDWHLNTKETELSRTFAFPTFVDGLAFVAKIAVHAELLQHHPDIELSYSKVKIVLTTHDVKGLTNEDFELAKRIDTLRTP